MSLAADVRDDARGDGGVARGQALDRRIEPGASAAAAFKEVRDRCLQRIHILLVEHAFDHGAGLFEVFERLDMVGRRPHVNLTGPAVQLGEVPRLPLMDLD